MTEKEMLKVYKQAFDDIADYCDLSQFQLDEFIQEASRKVKRKVSLTEDQKNALHEKLNAITSATGHVYDFIETKESPTIHTRLYHTNLFVEDGYDSIAGYIVSFQAEKFNEGILYPIEEVLDEHI